MAEEYPFEPRVVGQLPPIHRQSPHGDRIWAERYALAYNNPGEWVAIHAQYRAGCAASARNLRIRKFRTGHDGTRKGDPDLAIFLTATRRVDHEEFDNWAELYVVHIGTVEELTPVLGVELANLLYIWCLNLQHQSTVEQANEMIRRWRLAEDEAEKKYFAEEAIAILGRKLNELAPTLDDPPADPPARELAKETDNA